MSNHFVISINSYSNNNGNLFDCQLKKNQTKYFREFLQDNLTKSHIRVFDVIMQHVVKHDRTFPSLSFIAMVANCARSTVQAAINRLKELNIIQTEYRGYRKTLVFRMHQFYYKKRRELSSLVRQIVDLSLFFLLLSRPKKENRYLLKEKVDNLIAKTFSRDKIIMEQLTAEQLIEVRSYPGWVYEKSLIQFRKKLKEGTAICNQPAYFMGIFRQEAAKATPLADEQPFGMTQSAGFKNKKTTETGKAHTYVRPKDGPYALYKPEEKRESESDFEKALKIQLQLKKSPNFFLQISADGLLSHCTPVEQQQIRDIVAAMST
jgi:DNA-binding transcriptional regulator YhcF (GntR family)